MKLHELQILQWEPGTQHHRIAVTGTDVRRRAGEIGAAITTRRKNHRVAMKAVHAAFRQVQRDDAPAFAILHDEVDSEILYKELGIVFQRLLIERVQHRVTRTIRRRTGSLCRPLAKFGCHSTERALINPSVVCARERYAVMFQFQDRCGCLSAHVCDGGLPPGPARRRPGIHHPP